MVFILWITFSIIVGLLGKDRKIGFGLAVFWSLILSPLIGLIIVLLSNKNVPGATPKFKEYREMGEKAELKGKFDEALEHFMDSLYHLQNDYKNRRITSKDEIKRQKLIDDLELKIKSLKEKINII